MAEHFDSWIVDNYAWWKRLDEAGRQRNASLYPGREKAFKEYDEWRQSEGIRDPLNVDPLGGLDDGPGPGKDQTGRARPELISDDPDFFKDFGFIPSGGLTLFNKEARDNFGALMAWMLEQAATPKGERATIGGASM